MNLGKQIKTLRIKNYLTQKELAEKLKVTSKTISNWELGTSNPPIDVLKKIASFFDCSFKINLIEKKQKETN